MTEVIFIEENKDTFVPFKDLRMGDVFKPIGSNCVFLKIPLITNKDFEGNAVLLKEEDNDITGTITYFYEAQMVTVYDKIKIKITGYK